MDVEILQNKRQIQKKKWHVDLSDDQEIKEVSEKYEGTKGQLVSKVSDEDMTRILKRYASDPKMDLYTVAEVFDVSHASLDYMLKDKQWKEAYQLAKKVRGNLLIQEGYETASSPYNRVMSGEEVSMVEVASAKLKSNYCMMMGQALNPEWNPKSSGEHEGGGINLVVNTGIKIGI